MPTDLMAPPTKQELANAPPSAASKLMEPPTAQEIKAATDAKLSPLESAISGISKGLTFGHSDEIIGGARALGAKALDAVGVSGFEKPIGELYSKYRDDQRGHIDQARAENPKSFIAGDIAGSVASPVGKILAPVKGAGILANTGKVLAGGAVAGAGESEHNPLQSPDEAAAFAGDLGTGAALAGATHGVLSAAGGTINALKPSAIRGMASDKAVSAAGAMKKEMTELGPEGVQALGQRLLKDKVITAGVSLDEVATRAAAQKQSAGEAIGSALKNVDDLVKTGKGLIETGQLFPGSSPEAKHAMKGMLDNQFQFNMKRIGDRIHKELIEPNENNPLLKGEVSKLRSLAEDFRTHATQTLGEGNVVKGTQGRLTNFDSDTVPNAFKQEVYGVIKTELDDVVSKTGNLERAISQANGKSLGSVEAGAINKSASDEYQAAKKAYGSYADTEDMALNSLGRTTANRTVGLSDIITGTAAAATGGAPLGVAVGMGSKAIRKYGDSVAAVTLQKVADVMDKSPAIFGKFSSVIEHAMRSGTLPAVNLELMKDPDYRRIIDHIDPGSKTLPKPDPMQQKRDAIQRRISP